jgi:FixJ family two-component response regulator
MRQAKQLLVLDDDATVGQILVASAEAAGVSASHFEEPEAFIR